MSDQSTGSDRRKAMRRDLKFARLEDAVGDAGALLARGYEPAGNWDLAQCCHHLAMLMTWAIDGFPPMSWPRPAAAWVIRWTFARRWLNKVLKTGVWPTGTPTDERTLAPPGCTDAQGVSMLRQAVERLLRHRGPFKASPLFGMLDKQTLIDLHRIHAAHHLSFLVPKPSA